MKIHIVAQRLEKERILPRLANLLANNTGWSISDTPDENADINYFFPYLELERFPHFKATKIAAWFTHIDYAQPEKVNMWERAAKRCDLRLTSAKMYYDELKKYGATELVTPPLDRDKFKPNTT
jgi:hypothetical protein